MNLTNNTKVTNKAVLTNNPYLPTGGVSATGTATVPYTKLLDKSMAGQENPAYVEYALNINPSGDKFTSDNELEIVDIMGAGMSLSTDRANFFKVYDVTNVSDLLDSSGNVSVSQAQTGEDITTQCTIKNITGQELNGMAADDVGKPTYLITVPDGKHVVVIYWATFEGAEDEKVSVSNKASFFYNNAMQTGGGDETSDSIAAAEASSSMFTGPFFYLKKIDQFGNVVSGVKYTLYKVTLDANKNVTGRTEVMTKTTGTDGTVYFGHRTNDGADPLEKNTLYCLVETDAPAGYIKDSTPYYFEFKGKGVAVVDSPTGADLHQFISGGTYSFTNQFAAASYSMPVKKTINGKTIVSDTVFSFTLKQSSGETVYTDDNYTAEIPTNGIQTTITGSGETQFDTLYFTKAGTYTFTMTEDDLTETATKKGYAKDNNTFTVTIEVGTGENNDLVVKSATYTSTDSSVAGGDLSTSAPTFNNTSHLAGTITLHATKEVTNRTKPVQAGEFAFTVSVGGEVIAEKNDDGTTQMGEDGKPVKKLFYTEAGGAININIDIDQNDVGTKTYIISEVTGTDSNIKYSTDRVKVKVTIAEGTDSNGNAIVEATKYEYLTDPAVFTNEYQATGTLSLTGTKELHFQTEDGNTLTPDNGEFKFEVYEGNQKVATGTNDATGKITFTDITYYISDIGEHTYTIKEVAGEDPYVEYSKDVITVNVNVFDSDAGDGTLSAQVTKVDGKAVSDATEAEEAIKFINISTWVVPTGIRVDILPYAMMIAFAACVSMLLTIYRRKHRTVRRR
jgi:pilin isopeptide linkage protein